MDIAMKKRKIIFILGSMGRGGAERVISILSKKYANQGWDTSICMLLCNDVGYEIHPATKLIDFSKNGGSRIKRLPYWLQSVRSYIRSEKPDVVVSFAARINIIVLLATIGMRTKLIISERNDPVHDGRGFITKLLCSVLYPKASRIVVQTERIKSFFSKRIQNNMVIIPNPIEVGKVKRDSVNEDIVVNVGSLKAQKNHKLLINAFAEVVKVCPEMRLVIYGEGNLRQELELLISKLGIENKVELAGEVANVHEKIVNANMFVLSSNYEGLSNALLEAMMLGIPCISTRCSGADEFIEDHINGLLTPVGDKEALANAMLQYINNSELLNLCGENGKLVSKRVATDIVLEKWNQIIEENEKR